MAVVAAVVVLAGFLVTLAPTVTFWDAGELVAAAKILGIPHPPGTPLWVLVGHVWGLLIPFGDYAWRLNLLSAVSGAVAAGLWFLVTHSLVRRLAIAEQGVAVGAGFAAALLASFGFTNWQNAVEAEVYSIAMVTIAAAAWCAVRWCDLRDERHGHRLLLVLLYLGAVSIGNHLLALLIGPALVVLLLLESRRNPLLDAARRGVERSRIALLASAWLLLIALGLGSTTLALVTGGLFLATAAYSVVRHRQLAFVLAAVAIIAIGVSPYLFLFLRAQQQPFINEADPSTWNALVDVIRRAQYPIRTPLDDPTIRHGPANPGRTLTILGVQLANYVQYFDWQWARTLGDGAITSVARLGVTLMAVAAGLAGALAQWRRDRSGFWFVAMFFLVTGPGLVLYMNFKPGPSIGWELWPSLTDHEVRERDYFFVASFVAWSVWAAIGLAELVRWLGSRGRAARLAHAGFALALIPAALNFRDASRRHGADVTLARDFARALLDSVPPGGILFTWGDNDTFPLWHAQAVDGYRTDVTIVCLALAETPWYQRELIDFRPTGVSRASLPAVWSAHPHPDPALAIHELTVAEIEQFQPSYTDREYVLPLANGAELHIPVNVLLEGKDYALFAVLRANAGVRPVAWSVTAAQKLYGAPVVQQGLALVMPITMPDSSDLAFDVPGDAPLDITITSGLIDRQWDFGAMLTGDVSRLEPNVAAMGRTVAQPLARLGIGLLNRGDTTAAVAALERAAHLLPDNPDFALFVSGLRR